MAGALRKGIHRSSGASICAALLATAALLPASALAAQGPQPPRPEPVVTGDQARRDINVPDTIPNISGTWTPMGSNRSIQPSDGSATPFLPWAQAYIDNRRQAEQIGQPLFDPSANCLSGGIPRVILSPYPIDIIQLPNLTIISTETLHTFRMIHMDGKPPPPDYVPSYLGYSTGRWEGDVLVVETTGTNGYTQVDEEGRPKSSDMKIIERWHKLAPNLIEVDFTMIDPRTYSRPWTAKAQLRCSPDTRLAEYICEENNRNKPTAEGKLRHGTEK